MKLTRHERRGLAGGWNLSDGHARQDATSYAAVLKRLPELFDEGTVETQQAVEGQFESAFFGCAGQHAYAALPQPLYNFSCSLAIEVVANYLSANRMSTALIHPTFDNIADILRRNQVDLMPLDQDLLTAPELDGGAIAGDALFIVCPNNPTGQSLTRAEFRRVVDLCADRRTLLVLDFSFRFFSDFTSWDQYDVLRQSGVDFIALEDTGKTWPTQDLKVGLTVTSESVHEQMLHINEDLVLNVSPFTLKVLTACMDHDLASDESSARRTVATNRALLRGLIADTALEPAQPDSVISVEWLSLPSGWQASAVCAWLADNDIHVLPGMPFFWADPTSGESYLRVSYARGTGQFAAAAHALVDALANYRPE